MKRPTVIQAAIAAMMMTTGLSAFAQSAIVPSDNFSVPGDGQLSTILNRNTQPRTYQWIIAEHQLLRIPDGATIWGLSVRLSTAAGADISAATITNSVVTVSRLCYSPAELDCRADIDADGFVDPFDYELFVTEFEQGC